MSKKSNVAYYICDELDCGFKYTYKERRGPSAKNPLHVISVNVFDLGKKVTIRLLGFDESGLRKLYEMGHEGYIFPVNLFMKPYSVQVKVSKSGSVTPDLQERWLKMIASYKGETYVSSRKHYVLVSDYGEIIKHKLFNEEEFADAVNFSKKWGERHPNQSPMYWRLAEPHEEIEDASFLYSRKPQQRILVS